MTVFQVDENKVDYDLGRQAVTLIAEKRDSSALKSWLSNGQLGMVEMGTDQAYARLGIEDHSLEDDMVLTTFDIRLSEMPSETEDLREALRSIGRARGSQKIGAFLQSPSTARVASSDWPVGLENIGNTCYLNSLLQFYFTVKPLRELILNFYRVEMAVTHEMLSQKRVGSRKVSLREIERAKKCKCRP